MIAFPNAKINIGLNIIRKREDNFHDIESIFYPIGLCDALEIIEDKNGKTGNCTFSTSGLVVSSSLDDNLCVRAYRLLNNDFPIPAVKIHLHKVIPMGAGLGGGSSDAVSVIKILNQIFHLSLDTEKLQNYARKIGSDCAFFVENRTVIALGKGDYFKNTPLSMKGYRLMLVCPPVHVSTKDAYSHIKPRQHEFPPSTLVKQSIYIWKEKLVNDFEASVFSAHPKIAEIKSELHKMGAIYASMTGSGSAVYGILKDGENMGNSFPGCFTWSEVLK